MRKSLAIAVIFCGLTIFAENLALNGDFKENLTGWKGAVNVGGKLTKRPDFIFRITNDGAEGTKSCMKVSIEVPEKIRWASHCCGVKCRTNKNIPENSKVKITFYAKRVSGSPFLSVMRIGGGGTSDIVELLGKKWKKYSVTLTSPYKTSEFIFGLVHDHDRKGQRLVSGSFLIDNVSVEIVKKVTD